MQSTSNICRIERVEGTLMPANVVSSEPYGNQTTAGRIRGDRPGTHRQPRTQLRRSDPREEAT